MESIEELRRENHRLEQKYVREIEEREKAHNAREKMLVEELDILKQ